MPRRTSGFIQEAFHMDHLRTSPSQQHLDPTSRSLSSSHQEQDDLDHDLGPNLTSVGPNDELAGGQRPHKLDLYSIPVFLLECLILGALGYAAYFLHFQYKFVPLLSGFYCDDLSLRQPFSESKLTEQFTQPDNELAVVVLLLVVPLAIIIFCELVNSMFGSLKFRQIRSLCKCCKLHSITRRTLRFSGAYLLGFLIVMISCDILATSAGKFRPSFAQECSPVYAECLKSPNKARELSTLNPELEGSGASTRLPMSPAEPNLRQNEQLNGGLADDGIRPLSQPISSLSSSNAPLNIQQAAGAANTNVLNRKRRDTTSVTIDKSVFERKWIDLSRTDLNYVCGFRGGDSIQTRKFDRIAMSWPSFPGAIITYACLYLGCYLSFVGTARPFRLITSVLVSALLLAATIFNVQLVKEHYNHWADVAGGAGLSFVVVIFVTLVYLNKFRDTHYYENQKLYGSASRRQQQLKRSLMLSQNKFGYNNEAGQYQLNKIDGGASAPVVQTLQNGTEDVGATPAPNNDLAMRYFQIPRANYRGAPRPLSSMNRT